MNRKRESMALLFMNGWLGRRMRFDSNTYTSLPRYGRIFTASWSPSPKFWSRSVGSETRNMTMRGLSATTSEGSSSGASQRSFIALSRIARGVRACTGKSSDPGLRWGRGRFAFPRKFVCVSKSQPRTGHTREHCARTGTDTQRAQALFAGCPVSSFPPSDLP